MKLRTIRVAFSPEVVELVVEICRTNLIEDVGLGLDMLALIRSKGNGIPTDERLNKMAQVYSKHTELPENLCLMFFRKRKALLSSLSALPAFVAVCNEKGKSPLDSLDEMLSLFKEMNKRRVASVCSACPLLKKCGFGNKYIHVATDPTKVIDPEWDKLIDSNCPSRSIVENRNNYVQESINNLSQLSPNNPNGQLVIASTPDAGNYASQASMAEDVAEEHNHDASPDDDISNDMYLSDEDIQDPLDDLSIESMGAGKVQGVGSSTGNTFAKVQLDFVRKLSLTSLQLFDLGKQLDSLLGKELKDKFKPSKTVSERTRKKTLEDVSEASKATVREQANDDKTFDQRMVKGELNVVGNLKPETKKHLLYVILDHSGSMSLILTPNGNSLLTRGQLAGTLSGALFRRVQADDGVVYFRYFGYVVTRMLKAEKKEEFDPLIRRVIRADYNGGGTNISGAIHTAIDDIAKARDRMSKAEILLITDMDDSISDEEEITKKLKDTKIVLNVLNVNAIKSYGNAESVLARISSKYMKVDPTQLDLSKLVNVIK